MQEAQFNPSSGDWGFTCCVVWPKFTRAAHWRQETVIKGSPYSWTRSALLTQSSPIRCSFSSISNKIRELDSGKILLNLIAHHWTRVAITKLFLSFLLLSPQNWVSSTPFPNLILQVLMDIVKLQHLSKNTILLNLPKVDFFCSK